MEHLGLFLGLLVISTYPLSKGEGDTGDGISIISQNKMAERVGFEPTVANATRALQARLIGHSSTSPFRFAVRFSALHLS